MIKCGCVGTHHSATGATPTEHKDLGGREEEGKGEGGGRGRGRGGRKRERERKKLKVGWR